MHQWKGVYKECTHPFTEVHTSLPTSVLFRFLHVRIKTHTTTAVQTTEDIPRRHSNLAVSKRSQTRTQRDRRRIALLTLLHCFDLPLCLSFDISLGVSLSFTARYLFKYSILYYTHTHKDHLCSWNLLRRTEVTWQHELFSTEKRPKVNPLTITLSQMSSFFAMKIACHGKSGVRTITKSSPR